MKKEYEEFIKNINTVRTEQEIKNIISSYILTTNEVKDSLGYSKPMITHLVKIGKIQCLRQTANGSLFFKPDIEILIKEKIEKAIQFLKKNKISVKESSNMQTMP